MRFPQVDREPRAKHSTNGLDVDAPRAASASGEKACDEPGRSDQDERLLIPPDFWARDSRPPRQYVIRIDNWFGPKWMHFAGKFPAGKGFAVGVHKTILHVPPFVPHRVVAERVFAGPNYEEAATRPPLHIERTSE